MLLELGLFRLLSFLFFSFFYDRITLVIEFWLWLLRWLWLNNKNFKCSVIAHWVTIENITSVLAVILAESPAESLAHQL